MRHIRPPCLNIAYGGCTEDVFDLSMSSRISVRITSDGSKTLHVLRIGDKRQIQFCNDASKTVPKACYARLTFFVQWIFDMSSTFISLCKQNSWAKADTSP